MVNYVALAEIQGDYLDVTHFDRRLSFLIEKNYIHLKTFHILC